MLLYGRLNSLHYRSCGPSVRLSVTYGRRYNSKIKKNLENKLVKVPKGRNNWYVPTFSLKGQVQGHRMSKVSRK